MNMCDVRPDMILCLGVNRSLWLYAKVQLVKCKEYGPMLLGILSPLWGAAPFDWPTAGHIFGFQAGGRARGRPRTPGHPRNFGTAQGVYANSIGWLVGCLVGWLVGWFPPRGRMPGTIWSSPSRRKPGQVNPASLWGYRLYK